MKIKFHTAFKSAETKPDIIYNFATCGKQTICRGCFASSLFQCRNRSLCRFSLYSVGFWTFHTLVALWRYEQVARHCLRDNSNCVTVSPWRGSISGRESWEALMKALERNQFWGITCVEVSNRHELFNLIQEQPWPRDDSVWNGVRRSQTYSQRCHGLATWLWGKSFHFEMLHLPHL